MRKAVLFDLDDTLTDRRLSIARYARRLCGDHREALSDIDEARVAQVIADADGGGYAPRQSVFSALQTRLSWHRVPEAEHLADHWERGFPADTAGRDDLAATLARLGELGFLLGVVTNGRVKLQLPKIDQLKIAPLLTSVVVSEAVGFAKPHPKIFQLALEHLACAPGDAWFVGDHPQNDVLGAASAGLNPVWLRGHHPWPAGTPPCSHAIDRLGEILALVGGSS